MLALKPSIGVKRCPSLREVFLIRFHCGLGAKTDDCYKPSRLQSRINGLAVLTADRVQASQNSGAHRGVNGFALVCTDVARERERNSCHPYATHRSGKTSR